MKKDLFLIFQFFVITFVGFVLTNILGSIIYGLAEGNILQRICELPYLLYGIFAFIISLILYFRIVKR